MLGPIGANERIERGLYAPVTDLLRSLAVGADDRELDVLQDIFILLLEGNGHQRASFRYSWIARNTGRGLPSALRMPNEACSWRGCPLRARRIAKLRFHKNIAPTHAYCSFVRRIAPTVYSACCSNETWLPYSNPGLLLCVAQP